LPAPSIPQNFYVTQGNIQVFLQWDIVAGATSYSVQRSLDGVTYSSYATVTANNYLDTAVTSGTNYFYQVASTNGSGTSPYTSPQSIVPTTSGELSLGEIRLAAQQKADRVGSNFVTLPEWNSFINRAMFELYDILTTQDEDYFVAPQALFRTNGTDNLYPLPNGVLTFQDINGNNFVPPPFYRLKGVDLAVQNAAQAFVTVNKFNWQDRNKYIYPNTASTIFGVFNLQYRLMGDKIELIPAPSGNQVIKLWYTPRLRMLVKDNDVSDISISGWIEYVICRAAKYALDKEESDTSKIDAELLYLKERIEDASINRDVGQPDRITDIRQTGNWGNNNSGWGGPVGGI
jgi:hypothetical protein